MVNDHRNNNEEERLITFTQLQYILETNKKAIEIHIEVEQQNEQILSALEKLNERTENIEKNAEEVAQSVKETEEITKKIEKNIFRLIIILSSAGAGLIYTIIQSFFHH